MSDEQPPYNEIFVKAWTLLSIIIGSVLLLMFALCNHVLHLGDIVWSLIRWIFSPII